MANNKMKENAPKIVFMGTPEFAETILQTLVQKGYEPVLVVTAPDQEVGRKKIITAPPVKNFARRHGISILQPFRVREIKEQIKGLEPDIIIVAAYGYFLPKEIYEIPRFGTINIHPSLLPKFRGPSPIQTSILEGELTTGVTIIKIDEEIDHGPIIARKAIEMPKKIYYKDLEAKLAELGSELLIDILPKWLNGKIEEIPQDDTMASFTKIIDKEDGRINWAESTAHEIERKIRAFHPWPSTYAYWENDNERRMVKILEAEPIDSVETSTVGKVYSTRENKIVVQCKGDSLVVKRLQVEGKNPLTEKEFVLGYEGFIGSVLK